MLTITLLNVLLLSCTIIECKNSPKIIQYVEKKYEPNWNSLDTRPLPTWYDRAKIGIFIHWGVFSVPSFGSEWFWKDWKSNSTEYVNYIKSNFPNGFSYQEFAKEFKAEFFNPDEWAKLFQKSGAKYVVLTSKHHEGFTLWPSKYSFSWNSMDIGPHRDLIQDLSEAVRNVGLTFGLYHSLYEWFNPMYLNDQATNFTQKEFVTKKMLPEMYELILNYKPEILWSDGDWEAQDTYFESTKFLAWLYNESPVKNTIVVNDRWGSGIPCNHGDFYTCSDRYNPGVLQNHKWENAMTLDSKSWGFRRNAPLKDYLTIHELLKTLAETISCGGNLLINVGPTKEGVISPIFEERLLDLGKWLEVNGDGIYETIPWVYQNDTITKNVWYTRKMESVYAIVLDWPEKNVLFLGSMSKIFVSEGSTKINLFGYENELEQWNLTGNGLEISLPEQSTVKTSHAWVLEFTGLNPHKSI